MNRNAGKDRALRQHTEGRSQIQQNLIEEFKTRKYSSKNKLKTLKKNEIKAKIAGGIWKFRTKFWNDSIKIYSGHVVHSQLHSSRHTR